MRGCSGARTRKVAPYKVSARVVKALISSFEFSILNVILVPSVRPIQFLWAIFVFSDQSIVSRFFNNRSAYLVILRNHCYRSFCKTTESHLSHFPSMTCSSASTVLQEGHQSTGALPL